MTKCPEERGENAFFLNALLCDKHTPFTKAYRFKSDDCVYKISLSMCLCDTCQLSTISNWPKITQKRLVFEILTKMFFFLLFFELKEMTTDVVTRWFNISSQFTIYVNCRTRKQYSVHAFTAFQDTVVQ